MCLGVGVNEDEQLGPYTHGVGRSLRRLIVTCDSIPTPVTLYSLNISTDVYIQNDF